jgi:LacI family transcriptional regulator
MRWCPLDEAACGGPKMATLPPWTDTSKPDCQASRSMFSGLSLGVASMSLELLPFDCMQEKKRPTIIDVALAAKVGASTVSRYVRGGKSVSPRVGQRIEAAIEQLGYQPNTLARGLRMGRTQTLGVLFPHVNNVFFGNVIRIIQVEAQRSGFTVMLLMHQEDPKLQRDQLASLKRSHVDGIILVPAAGTNVADVRQLLGETPVVAFDRPLAPELDSVTLHNRTASFQATEHLLWHGHRHILAITAPYKLHPLRSRLKGYEEAMTAAGGAPETLVWRNAEGLKRDLSLALTRKQGRVTAVLSMSYSVTIAILAALRDCSVPLAEIGFIGIDDLEFASFIDPPLTTVAQPAERLAQLAVERLLRRIQESEDAAAIRIKLPGILIVRSSCGCYPAQFSRR